MDYHHYLKKKHMKNQAIFYTMDYNHYKPVSSTSQFNQSVKPVS